MGAVALGLLALMTVLMLRAGSGDQMALLYGDLDPREASQIVDQLNRRHVPYRIGAGGGQILVPADQVAESRMLLAKDGLPSGGSIGYELFDRGDGYLFLRRFSRRSVKPARWRARSPAPSARSAAFARPASILSCRAGNPSRAAAARKPRRSVMLTMVGAQVLDKQGVQDDPQPRRRRRAGTARRTTSR